MSNATIEKIEKQEAPFGLSLNEKMDKYRR